MRFRGAWLLGAALAGFGCVRVQGQVAPAAPPTQPVADAPWHVGAAVVDITPPVGYGMAGHAIEARSSLGVWTRLRAQAIAIEDRDGVPVILISADLWAIPAALPDAITERLQTEHGLASLGRAQLLVAATHTHHGPGHFHTAPGYADHAGSERGFDPHLFEWLTARLASAAADAYAQRRPATLAHHAVAVPSIARNRSVTPFLHNPEADALIDSNAGMPGCEHPPSATPVDAESGVDPCHALDPRLDTLVARELKSGAVIAVAAVFGVHATAMPNETPVYHGDLFGIASRSAQQALEEQGNEGAIVAVFNGPEGDISPNWRTQGRGATVALGRGLGEALVASVDTQGLSLRGTVGYGLARAPISEVTVSPTTVAPGRTARVAMPGRSQFGGAEDGRTRLSPRGFDEGRTSRRPRRKGQGAKRPALPPALVSMVHPKRHLPSVIPVGLVQLGPLSLLTLPGEVTTILGQRIEQRVNAARTTPGPTVSIGLAGEYLSYFTTPEEFDLQHYEGASMMYGRLSGEVLAETAEGLIKRPRVDGIGAYDYRGRGKTSVPKLRRKLRRPAKNTSKVVADTLEFGASVTLNFEDERAHWPESAGDPTTPRAVSYTHLTLPTKLEV
ncbi:MAG: neutral/alkaline non-lysosomal ceramidase N-terminal domain-containing protein [Nannocystaceae bacterium]|nr:neutral/alkaline non-lysosomal ceramidase N-terminal domain-containing protein [Nannocystaceae bacterium]